VDRSRIEVQILSGLLAKALKCLKSSLVLFSKFIDQIGQNGVFGKSIRVQVVKCVYKWFSVTWLFRYMCGIHQSFSLVVGIKYLGHCRCRVE